MKHPLMCFDKNGWNKTSKKNISRWEVSFVAGEIACKEVEG